MSIQKIATIVILGLTALMVLSCLWLGWFFVKTVDDSYSRAVAKAKADGFLVNDIRELFPKPKPGENGAELYEKAAKLLKGHEPAKAVTALGNAADRRSIQHYLVSVAPALRLASEAADRPYAVYESDAKVLFGDRYPELEYLKVLADDFVARAKLRSLSGDLTASMRDLETVAKMGRQIGKMPMVIHTLVQTSIDRRAYDGIGYLLNHRPESAELMGPLFETLAIQPDLVQAFRGEMLQSDQYYRQLISGQPTSHDEQVEEQSANESAHGKRVRSPADPLNRLVLKRSAMYNLSLGSRLLVGLGRESKFSARIKLAKQLNYEADHPSTVLDMALSATQYEGLMRDCAINLARYRVYRQAVTILMTGRRLTKLPLEGELAEDPTDDQPLRYRPTDAGFKVWALGHSGIDQGGRARVQKSHKPYDTIFIYEPVPSAKKAS